jgi:hypothetical protein
MVRARYAGGLLAAGVLIFYLVTLAPGLVWGDGGRLQLEATTGASVYWHFDELQAVDTDGWPFDRLGAAAWDHPVWVALGHGLVQLPVGESAWKLNLLSALAATVGVAAVFAVIRRLTGAVLPAAVGAISLAVAHTYWFHAVTAQVHALNAMFMALLIWAAVSWTEMTAPRWAALAFVAGLGVANHVMLGLTVVLVGAYLVVRRRQRPPAWVPLCGLLGLMPWWLQLLRMARVAGLPTTLAVAGGFPWLGDRWPGPLADVPGNLLGFCGMLLYQYTPLGCALGVLGAYWLLRRSRVEGSFLLLLFVLSGLFSANYTVPDRFAFHLPAYLVFAVFIGCGAAGVLDWARGGSTARTVAVRGVLAVALVLPAFMYAAVPSILRRHGVTDADIGVPPVAANARDGMAFFLDPNTRGDDSAERFGRRALTRLAPDSLVLLAWPQEREAYLVMRYFQLTEGLRRDVTLDMMMFTGEPVGDSVLRITRAQRGCRPLYLISTDPAVYPIRQLSDGFTVSAEGDLFRLHPKPPTETVCPGHEPAPVNIEDLLRRVRR